MTAVEYLSRAKYLQRLIAAQQREIDRLQMLSSSARTSKIAENNNPNCTTEATFVAQVHKLAELEEHMNKMKDHYSDLLCEIHACIEALPDMREQLVLKHRYIEGMSWKEVIGAMDVSESTTYRIHKAALKHLKYPGMDESH